MTDEKIEILIGRLKCLTNDLGFVPLKKEMTEDELHYRDGWNKATSKIIDKINDLLDQFFGEWDETYKCHSCKGKGYKERSDN